MNELNSIKVSIGDASVIVNRSNASFHKKLWDYEVKVFSQWGEDGILSFICDTLEISKPKILEIGAGEFNECNSKYLVYSRNSSAVLVDSNSNLIRNIKKSDLEWKTHLKGLNHWVTPKNINQIRDQAHDYMRGIDILSIDLDGNDFWILNELNLDTIRVLIVEYNPIFGSRHSVSIPRNDEFNRSNFHYSNLFWGASILAYVNLLSEKGFKLIGTNRVGCNAFFIDSSLSDKFQALNSFKLEDLVDWRIRESRDHLGRKTFLDIDKMKKSIENLEVQNTLNGELVPLLSIFED